MADDIVQVILDAREDATSLSQFMYYPANSMVERRLSPQIHSLNYYLNYLQGLELVYSQESGTVTVNGEEVKTVRQSINDSVDSVILGEYQTQLEEKVDGLSSDVLSQKLDTGITTTAKFGGVDRKLSEKNSDIVSIKDFGAVGDGVTDDTTAIQKALDVGGLIYFPKGDYVISAGLTATKSVQILAYGANIIYNSTGGGAAIAISGTTGSEINLGRNPFLTTSIDNQRTNIKTVSAHGLVKGDRVLIQSHRSIFSNDAGFQRLGTPTAGAPSVYFAEIVTVQAVISSNEFETVKQLEFTYYAAPASGDTTGDARANSTIRKMNFLKDVSINGLTINGNSPSRASVANTLIVALCESPKLKDVNVIKSSGHGRGIMFANVWKGEIDNCVIDNSKTEYIDVFDAHVPDNHFTFMSSWHCTAKNCGSLHGGQSFDTTYGGFSINGTNTIACPSIYISIEDCFVDGSLDNAATCHSGTYRMTIDRCQFIGNARGILIRSPYTTISNCKIYSSLENAQDSTIMISEPTIHGCRVKDNQIIGGDASIRISPYVLRGLDAGYKDLNIVISGNTFSDVKSALLIDPWQYGYEADGTTLNASALKDVNIIFKDNTIHQNELGFREAVFVGDLMHGVTIKDNIFNSTKDGILIRTAICMRTKVIGNTANNQPLNVFTNISSAFSEGVLARKVSPNLNTYNEYYGNSVKSNRVSSGIPSVELRNPQGAVLVNVPSTPVSYMNLHKESSSVSTFMLGSGDGQHTRVIANNDFTGIISEYVRANANTALSQVRWNIGEKGFALKFSNLSPVSDNDMTLGIPSARWSTIYAGAGVINTSDERLKTKFDDLKAAEKRAAIKIKESIGRYQFKDSIAEKGKSNARYHFGVGAQTVADIMRGEGLNPEQYAFYCYDEWVTSDSTESGERYGIRYDELSMFLHAST